MERVKDLKAAFNRVFKGCERQYEQSHDISLEAGCRPSYRSIRSLMEPPTFPKPYACSAYLQKDRKH